MSNQYSTSQDIKEAAAMAEGLEDYVRGSELYGQTGGGFFTSTMPSLTVGALVMRLRRLHTLRDTLDTHQQAQLDTLQTQFDHVQQAWNVHFTGKILREATSRLDAMKPFFGECQHNPKSCDGIYAPELLRRTIIEELLPLLEANQIDTSGLITKLRATDVKLRGVVRPSAFNWAAPLQAVYPSDRYWWLYQRPPQD